MTEQVKVTQLQINPKLIKRDVVVVLNQTVFFCVKGDIDLDACRSLVDVTFNLQMI